MSQDRSRRIRRGFADGASQDDGPPDSGRCVLAQRAEAADAIGRLADVYRRPLRDDDPWKPLTNDIARALTEGAFTLHHSSEGWRLQLASGGPQLRCVRWCEAQRAACREVLKVGAGVGPLIGSMQWKLFDCSEG